MTQRSSEIVEDLREEIVNLGRDLFDNPELGYKEFKTREILGEYIRDIPLTDFKTYAITGFKATIGEGSPHIGLLFDMDALPTKGHKNALNEDHAAHSCGHNAQMAVMVAAFKALARSKALEKYGGRVSIIGAPAEEFVDFDYRLNLIKDKKLKVFSGKQNLIADGAFDDVDLIIGGHGNSLEGHVIETGTASNGFVAKTAVFKGVSAHSGAYPHRGKNALNAALLALNAVALLRETFQDDDHIRFHPIIKEGGDAVNTVPHRVVIETYIRGSSVVAIEDANKRIDNAFIHSAKAMGCECEIETMPGYLPSNYFELLENYISDSSREYISKDDIHKGGRTFASDDIADVSSIVPVAHFGFSGFGGSFHGADFYIKDEEMAYVTTAKIVTDAIENMLSNKEKLTNILEKFTPVMSKEEYITGWLNLD